MLLRPEWQYEVSLGCSSGLRASDRAAHFARDPSAHPALCLLTGTLRAQLAEILATAKRADTDEASRNKVVGPLRATVGDLVAGIERRQRGLDSQQEEVQAEIATLLHVDWFGAVERCQSLLDITTDTLRELNEMLRRNSHHFVAVLQEAQVLATAVENTDAEETIQRVSEHVDRIAAWGAVRQRTWSDYYQYRPCVDRETLPTVVASGDALGEFDELVRADLARGTVNLTDVTARVRRALPSDVHYAATGRIADALARITRMRAEHERSDWTVSR